MDILRILYVSSDRDASGLMPQLLHDYPWKVESVHTAREALQAAAGRPFDLYVLGYWWLDDGVHCRELLLDLRHQDPSTPVLFYSANASPRDVDAALATGAAGYVVKPDTEGLLERTIHAVLASSLSRGHEARLEELPAAVDEIRHHLNESELALAASGVALKSESARVTSAFSLLLKAQARIAFYDAGGTRSQFERMWPGMLEEALERAG